MKKGFKKEVELEYDNDENQLVTWTIWTDTLNDNKKWLRLYVNGYNYNHFGNLIDSYVFGNNIKEPRSLFTSISDFLYELIMDKENSYDLFNDVYIEEMLRKSSQSIY